MATYYIDNDFASAIDPDGGAAPLFSSIDITNTISARVYRGDALLGEYSNISSGWTTPIDTEVVGKYTIEYFVTDARGATATVSRQINITRGILTDESAYSSLISQVTHGMFQAGYHQSVTPQGDWAACSFMGHWSDITNSNFTFPSVDYNAYDGDPHTSSNRATFNGHGAVVFKKTDANNPIIMQAQDVLGYWKTSFKIYGIGDDILATNNNTLTEVGQFIRWTHNGTTHTYQIENVGINNWLRRISIVGNREQFSLPNSSSSAVDAYTTVYSEAPGKEGKLADITLPDSSAPSIVPRVPTVINGSPYTRARNIGTLQAPEGFAWTMRYENDQWIVDGLFSTPLGAGSYRKFGRNVEISKDGSTIAIHAASYTYIYKRVAVFSGLIYQRASSTPSVPPTGSAIIPSGWSSSDPGGSGNLYACRGKTANSGSTYSWSSAYLVAQPDFPHSGNIHTSVSSDYGWNLVGTFSGGADFGESISFSSNGNIVGIGHPGNKLLKVYEYNGSSWSQKGATINSPVKTINQYTTVGSRYFGKTVSCDDSGLTFIVGGDGWYSDDPQESSFRYPGSVNCYAFVNGSWQADSIQSYGHRDSSSPGHTQTSQSSTMYFQPSYYNSYDDDVWNFMHGQYVTITGDGDTMYIVSHHANQYPKSKNWSSSKTYTYQELANYSGDQYISITSNNTSIPTNTTYWSKISSSRSINRWVLGYDETNRTLIRGNILKYKKVTSGIFNSGFYWKYEGFILPPKTLGYYGWYHNELDSIAISSDASTILIGSSHWHKYTVGDGGGTRIGREVLYDGDYYYPGGWAFIEDKDAEIYDADSGSFTTFINVNSYNPDIDPSYFPAPDELSIFNDAHWNAIRSLTPNESFILYIKHNFQTFRETSYTYYLGGTNTTEPPSSASTGSVALDINSEYQAIEVFKNNPIFEYFWIRINNQYDTSDWSTRRQYDLSLSIAYPPPEPIDTSIEVNKNASQVKVKWTHGIRNSNNGFLGIQNQAEQYSIWSNPFTFSKTIAADYSKVKTEYTADNIEFTSNYSASDPGAPVAHLKTFYVRATNSHSSSSIVNAGSIYTYDFADATAPGLPINFETNTVIVSSFPWYAVLMDFKIPYDGYTGGEPKTFIFYMTTNPYTAPALTNFSDNYTSGTMNAEFLSSSNIKSDGFRHFDYAAYPNIYGNIYMGQLVLGSTYYFWVRAENSYGSSNWVASQTNTTGGIKIE